MKNKLISKVGWILSTSSLGFTLVTAAHASEVRVAAQAETQYAMAHVQTNQPRKRTQLSAEAALQKGMSLMNRAETAKQHVQAFRYLNYAAKKGLPEAMFQCALMYLDNQYTPADDERAMSLLEKASEQGHEQAEIALNYIQYADGGIGC
jgi:TPR repeat protein